jgi:ribosomal protein S18 acetylase RimI-like enzyme
VEVLLNNPVYHALLTGDAPLSAGTGSVRFFNPEVSPFAGFSEDDDNGFDDLHQQLPAGRNILFATRKQIEPPKGWQQIVAIQGLQFVFPDNVHIDAPALQPVPLGPQHIEEMIELTALTKPGPFGKRTIEFGHYHGFIENGRLAAMTGQRLHVANYTEISAVCTHPQHLGKGFAGALLLHQIDLIRQQGQTPFLHVRADNDRAIALYKRLGFEVNGPMNFYFLKRL